MSATIPYTGAVDMSARTSALTVNIALATGLIIYGELDVWLWHYHDSGASTMFFLRGRNTQVITSAGKTFSGNCFTVETPTAALSNSLMP
jgi:hypothetical protein